MRRAWLFLALATSGCAFDAGDPYGLASAELDARYLLRDDRDLGDGWQKLASEYQLRVEEMVLVGRSLELIDSGGPTETQSFDPANPPPGYSLCHNGHCHSDDGALVSYEEIEAELAGSSGRGGSIALTLLVPALDLVDARPTPLECLSDCLLSEGQLSTARLVSRRLEVRGLVRDGLEPPRITGEVPFRADVDLSFEQDASIQDPSLQAPLDEVLSDDEPPRIHLTLVVEPSAALFDAVAFERAPTDGGGLSIFGAEAISIRERYGELEMNVNTLRSEIGEEP